MKTNVEGIYAAGDIVEFPLFTAGDQQVNVQHWQMAHAHGEEIYITSGSINNGHLWFIKWSTLLFFTSSL